MASVTLDVFTEEGPTNRAGGHFSVVAIVSGPFSKVVGKIKGRRRRVGIFVVNEMDVLDFLGLGRSWFFGKDNHIGTQQVTVSKDQLGKDC